LSIGGAYPYFASGSIDEEVAGGFGLMWSFDAGNLIFDIKGEGYFNKVNTIYFLDIDVNYPFLTKPNTPFVMAGMGWGGINARYDTDYYYGNGPQYEYYKNSESRNGGGLMGFAGGGYIINRTSNVRLRLSARGFYAFYNLDGWYNNESDKTQPFGGIVSVAVLFKR
jgi:hypothetical protein